MRLHRADAWRDVVDHDNLAAGADTDTELPCVQAMQFLADVQEMEAGAEINAEPEIENAVGVRCFALVRVVDTHKSSAQTQT